MAWPHGYSAVGEFMYEYGNLNRLNADSAFVQRPVEGLTYRVQYKTGHSSHFCHIGPLGRRHSLFVFNVYHFYGAFDASLFLYNVTSIYRNNASILPFHPGLVLYPFVAPSTTHHTTTDLMQYQNLRQWSFSRHGTNRKHPQALGPWPHQ